MADLVRRWDPFRDLLGIQEELNRLFGRTLRYGDEVEGESPGAWIPAIDIRETADGYVVETDLPGIDPKDVDITVEDNTLTIKGERRVERETEGEGFHRSERRYGSFVRSITLPATAKQDEIEASFDRGVLRLSIPKAEQAK